MFVPSSGEETADANSGEQCWVSYRNMNIVIGYMIHQYSRQVGKKPPVLYVNRASSSVGHLVEMLLFGVLILEIISGCAGC